jgi:pimeloyl-ACP methyl ester carboxylesterase
MDNKYIKIEETQIFYLEKNKEATPILFFIHGNSCSSNTWRKQLNDPLFADYRLIAFDLPCHGKSDAAKEADCTLPGLARLISNGVKQLSQNKPFILAGVSLATNIIAEMLAYDVNPAGIVLAGPCIAGGEFTLQKMVKPGTHVAVVFEDDALMEDVKAYAKETSLSNAKDDLDYFLQDYVSVAKPFRSLLAQSIFNNQMSNQIELLQKDETPLLMIFGKDEKVVDTNYLNKAPLHLWQNEIFKIEGASHLVNIDQPDKFNRLLLQFAEDVFK